MKKNWSLKNGVEIKLFWNDIIWIACIAFVFVISYELFYRMIDGNLDYYRSDFPYYAKLIMKMKGFKPDRLVEFVSINLHNINHSTMEFNLLAALVVAATVVVNYLVVSFHINHDCMKQMVPRYAVQVVSLAAFFVGPIYSHLFHKFYYKGSFSSYAWHSPTQQLMTLVSMLAILCFLKMLINGVGAKEWILTATMMLLSATVKPSFIISMVPSVIIIFFSELLTGEGDDIKNRIIRLFAIGCTLIPATLFILWLNTKEFGDKTLSGDTAHIIFGLEVLKSKEGILTMFVFGMMFTIIMCIANHKRFIDKKYLLSALLFIFGVLQWLLFAETGDRARDGNFTWGRIFTTYYLTLLCLTIGLENIYNEKSVPFKNRWARMLYFAIIGIVLAMHIISQGVYFSKILRGQSYWQ